MLAIQKRREERLAAEALEQKLKDDAQAIIDEDNKKNKEANDAARKKLEEDIAKGIVPAETKIDPDADLDNLTREEHLLLFGENHVELKDMTVKAKITYAVLGVFALAALILIILAIAGVFDSFLTNPCWEPPKQVRQTLDYYNTSAPLPGEEDSLIETWVTTPNYDYRAYPLPFDWCNKKYQYFDPTTKKNANYIKKDAKYLWGRYYINHGANDACFVTHTIVLDSMCTDPALLPNRTEVAPTKMTAPSPSTSTTKNATANKGSSGKKDIPLKDPCWLTIQGETEINRAHWDWEAQQHAIRNSNGGRRERALKVANAGAQDTSSSSSPDPFVPSLSTTCESHEIATTKRGVGGLPPPVCVSPRLTTTTVLDGGGVKQLFHITTGAKLSIRNLILRNFKATGNCFCKKPHNTCGGGAIFITNRNSHLFANNIIFQANKAWIGGAIFGADKASVSLVSTDIVYNIAKNNGTNNVVIVVGCCGLLWVVVGLLWVVVCCLSCAVVLTNDLITLCTFCLSF
jgi:hypothetical protein